MTPAERGRAFVDALVEKNFRFRNQPAYASSMTKARKAGLMPRRREVFVCFDWNLIHTKPRIVVNLFCEPEKVDWSFLSALDVVIPFDRHDEPRVEPLAQAILRAGPRRLQAWPLFPDDQGRYPTIFFKIAEAA